MDINKLRAVLVDNYLKLVAASPRAIYVTVDASGDVYVWNKDTAPEHWGSGWNYSGDFGESDYNDVFSVGPVPQHIAKAACWLVDDIRRDFFDSNPRQLEPTQTQIADFIRDRVRLRSYDGEIYLEYKPGDQWEDVSIAPLFKETK